MSKGATNKPGTDWQIHIGPQSTSSWLKQTNMKPTQPIGKGN